MSGLAIELLEGGVLAITLDRPKSANALDSALQSALVDTLAAASNDAEVRAVLLAASGGRVFSAGADLKEFSGLDPAAAGNRLREALVGTLDALIAFPKPVVAAVEGKAIGAGLMLALAADEVVISESASVSMPEIRLAMPSPIGLALLAARAGRNAAYRLIQAGDVIDARGALALGLADEIASSGEVWAAALRRARERGQASAAAFAANKAWLHRGVRDALGAATAEARRLQDTKLSGDPA